MTLRLATPADSALLAAFDCVAGGQHHETEVRDWLAATAIGWLELPIDPRLLLLEDDAGLVGFGAHEVFDIDEPTSHDLSCGLLFGSRKALLTWEDVGR